MVSPIPFRMRSYEKHGVGGGPLIWNERADGVRPAAAPRHSVKDDPSCCKIVQTCPIPAQKSPRLNSAGVLVSRC